MIVGVRGTEYLKYQTILISKPDYKKRKKYCIKFMYIKHDLRLIQ